MTGSQHSGYLELYLPYSSVNQGINNICNRPKTSTFGFVTALWGASSNRGFQQGVSLISSSWQFWELEIQILAVDQQRGIVFIALTKLFYCRNPWNGFTRSATFASVRLNLIAKSCANSVDYFFPFRMASWRAAKSVYCFGSLRSNLPSLCWFSVTTFCVWSTNDGIHTEQAISCEKYPCWPLRRENGTK